MWSPEVPSKLGRAEDVDAAVQSRVTVHPSAQIAAETATSVCCLLYEMFS